MNRVRVLMADDNEDFLVVITRLLEPEFEVVKTVGDGQALIDQAAILEPDLLLLDISMPVLTGIEAARQLKAAGSKAKIVFLTVQEGPDYLRSALAAGALGYVVKCQLVSDLIPALREAAAGRTFVSPSLCAEQRHEITSVPNLLRKP